MLGTLDHNSSSSLISSASSSGDQTKGLSNPEKRLSSPTL